MGIINVMVAVAFGVVIGFLSCHLLKRSHQPGIAYLWIALAVVSGGIFVSVIADLNQTSWYLDGLGFGFLLYWLTILGGPGMIQKLWMRMNSLPGHSSSKK